MLNDIEFETPENIKVNYNSAGLGTRFLAWLIDYVLVLVGLTFFGLLLLLLGLLAPGFVGTRAEGFAEEGEDLLLYLWGGFVLVSGFASFLYYGLSEFFMHGQTLGKRYLKIRVVKANGFSLDGTSLFIRNVFRVIDHFPALWIVPFVSRNSQRLGDMAAGTVLIKEEASRISHVRIQLGKIDPSEYEFRFGPATLKKARADDFTAIEKLLENWRRLTPSEKQSLARKISEPLAERLGVAVPPPDKRLQFLSDLLAAEIRSQYHRLG